MGIEPMLRAIRHQEKYAQLPIVVLAAERELPDVVRTSCSFVVFLPLSPPMLREALVWCFDRKSVQNLFPVGEPVDVPLVRGTEFASCKIADHAISAERQLVC